MFYKISLVNMGIPSLMTYIRMYVIYIANLVINPGNPENMEMLCVFINLRLPPFLETWKTLETLEECWSHRPRPGVAHREDPRPGPAPPTTTAAIPVPLSISPSDPLRGFRSAPSIQHGRSKPRPAGASLPSLSWAKTASGRPAFA